MARPAPASATGGRPGRGFAASTKYEAAHTIASSAQSDAGGREVGAGQEVQDQHESERGQAGAGHRQRPGRSPWRSQSHMTTAAGAVYSISSAGPTSIRSTAEK